jgi:flavin-dependent dehydrogenase
MPDETFDVVVVGARCAGSATARLLAQSGLRVLSLDKASFPSDTISTHGVGPVGVELLERWGLLDELLATGVPREDSVGLKLGDQEMNMQLPAGAFGPICPRRTVLDYVLVQAARAAGAEVRENLTFRDVIWQDGAIAGVRYTDRGGRSYAVRARLVIGADGVNSRVAKAVGAERYNVRRSRVSFRYAYYSGIATRRVEMAWVNPHFAYIFPTNEGLACMAGATADAGFTEHIAGGEASLIDLFETASPHLAELLRNGKRESKFYTYRRLPGRFNVPQGPGWALVGDASFFKDPVTGQGISDALAGAQLLADAVIEGFESPTELQQALGRYQRSRDELYTDAYAATQRLASLEWRNEELPDLYMSHRPSREKTAEILGLTPPERVPA